MTIDECILEFRQKSYEFEHAMCDEGTPEERKFYQTKWEHYKQLADWLEELKKWREPNTIIVRLEIEDIETIKNRVVMDLYDKVTEDIKARIKSWKINWSDREFELMDYAATTCLESLRYFIEQAKAGES